MRCALAQNRIIKVHEVLAQITRDNFFSMKWQRQKWGVLTQITINKLERCVTTKKSKEIIFVPQAHAAIGDHTGTLL